MMEKCNMVQALNQALRLEMARDERVVVLGEDVGKEGGVFRVTEGLQQAFGPDRVFDTPLAESAIVGTAFGMAVAGLLPVAEIQFSGFLYPAFDQIISHVGRIRNRSRGRFTCPLVVRMPSGGGIHAPEHHSESPEALLAHTPGIKVVMPSTPYDAKGMLISAIRDPDPVIFLEPTRNYRALVEEVPDEAYTVPLGQARVFREGEQVTVISWGSMIREALAAADQLDAEGISAEVIDVRSFVPFDAETVVASVEKTGRVVIVHEAVRTCGFGAEIIAQINEKALTALLAPVIRVTGFDTVMPLPRAEHLYLPNADRVVRAVRQVLAE
jgi:pyruvate dehydrogenase E1 component beta subunit